MDAGRRGRDGRDGRPRVAAAEVAHDLREAAYLADVIFVMSARPGKIINVHRVNLPRPRTLQSTFDPAFIEIVQKIRNEIAQVRQEGKTRRKTGDA